MPHLQRLISPLLDLSYRAGQAICTHYDSASAGVFEAKGDDSPLTRADLDSHAILDAGLEALGEAIPILSEESTGLDVAERLAWRRYWLVDPLDGTKEFLARTGEFTINIALIDNHRPVLGVLYLPLEERAYVGIPGVQATRYDHQGDGTWAPNKLETRPLQEKSALTVLASRRHRGPRIGACLDWLESHWHAIARENSGSALKFCRMAEGRGDFYPRFSPCCEWDTAAGQALLEAAGGKLLDLSGQPLTYNRGESLYSPDFYAIADPDHKLWTQVLAEDF